MIQSRNDVIAYIEDNCRLPSIRNAVINGKYEFMGGFKVIPPTTHPGWIISIRVGQHRFKHIAVLILAGGKYKVVRIHSIDWKQWEGDIEGSSTLRTGDRPDIYKELKDGKELQGSDKIEGCSEIDCRPYRSD